jgi:hypothetical protein
MPAMGSSSSSTCGSIARAPAQVHPLLQAVGQLAHRRLAVGLDLQEVDDVLDEFAVPDLLALGRADAQRLQEQVALDAQVAPVMMLSARSCP